MNVSNAVILNAGVASWAFEDVARRLSRLLGWPVSERPARFNYVLGWEGESAPPGHTFVPFDSVVAANDKRTLARIFAQHSVATPQTHLLDSPQEVQQKMDEQPLARWVLKWPTGCGASGHRLLASSSELPSDWPRPFVLQQFIEREQSEVFRLYAVAGELFGWNARRFPSGASSSPFVAHARGARYEDAGELPPEAREQARLALESTGLLQSFGCADLMQDKCGRWLVLEVNTDGLWAHVDRDVALGDIAQELDERLSRAVLGWAESSSANL